MLTEDSREFEMDRLHAEIERMTASLRLAEGERDALDRSHKDLAHRLADAGRESERLTADRERLRAALEFYADPATYVAIGFFPDPPCGNFIKDFSDDHGDELLPGPRPGKHAREALRLEHE